MIQDPDIFREQEIELRRLTVQLDDLKRQYDNYFVGLEKRQPGLLRARFDRAVRNTKLHTTLSTVLRFKFRQFLARYRTYSTNWDRICREIEEGTYRRGSTTAAERLAQQRSESALRRARGVDDALPEDDDSLGGDHRRLKDAAKEAEAFLANLLGSGSDATSKKAAPTPPPPVNMTNGASKPKRALKSDTDVVGPPEAVVTDGGAKRSATNRITQPTPSGGPPPPIRTTSPELPPAITTTDTGGLPPVIRKTSPPSKQSEGRRSGAKVRGGNSSAGVEALYASYLHARRSQGEDVSGVSLTKFSKSIEKQKAKARKRLDSDDVVLRVKVKGGKVKLVASKAPPKEE
jgi:cytochrome c1